MGVQSDNRMALLSKHGPSMFRQVKIQTKYSNAKVCGSKKAIWLCLTAVNVSCTDILKHCVSTTTDRKNFVVDWQ